MSEKPDGGPAFPLPDYTRSGMTLQDWFAGEALQGLVANGNVRLERLPVVARVAYEYADAMIAERNKRKSQ